MTFEPSLRLAVLGVLLLLPGFRETQVASQRQRVSLFEAMTTVQPGEYATAAREGTILPRAMTSGALALDITLAEGETVTLLRDEFERRGEDLTWRGRLQGEDSSRVVLTYHRGYVAGTIQRGTTLYRIRPGRGSLHIIELLDASRFPGESSSTDAVSPAIGLPDATLSLDEASIATDSPDQIRLMVTYSAAARAGAGGTIQIETLIQSYVDFANTAFADSETSPRLILVHTEEVSRPESGDTGIELLWLRSDPGIASLRDSYGADLISHIVEEDTPGVCGRAFMPESLNQFAPVNGFSALRRVCGALTFAHEVGHNFGFDHNPENGNDSSGKDYPWSYGHYVLSADPGESFRTLMSYSDLCPCPRVGHFSNPDVFYNGFATGIENARDNARTGDLTASIVAAYKTTEPDLTISSGTPVVTPATVLPGATVQLSAWTALNQGTAASGLYSTGFYLSTDAVITGNDVLLTAGPTLDLAAGESSASEAIPLTIPAGTTPGSYFVGILVDNNDQVPESDETNNYASTPLTVVLSIQPDLTISSGAPVVIPATAVPGGIAQLSAWTASNQGTGASGLFSTAFYLSADAEITGTDVLLASGPTLDLAAGESSASEAIPLTIPAGTTPGGYFVGILVDSNDQVPESDETNNYASTPLTVVLQSGSDDVIADFGESEGIWIWYEAPLWARLHELSPEAMATGDLDGNGQAELIVDFGAPYGIWAWENNATWISLHPLSPESMVTGDLDGNGQAELIVDFGAPYGIWTWENNTTWISLHPLSPESMVTGDLDGNSQAELIVDFGAPYGIWTWNNNATWLQLQGQSPETMVTGDLEGP